MGGEHEDTVNAQKSLLPGITPAVANVLFIIVALFNAIQPPLVIHGGVQGWWIALVFESLTSRRCT